MGRPSFSIYCCSWKIFTFQFFVILLLFSNHAASLNFSITSFSTNTPNMIYVNDSTATNGVIQLTKNQLDVGINGSVGRAFYSQPLRLWDKLTKEVTNFTTHFSFSIIQVVSSNLFGDGIAFFLVPFNDSTVYAPDSSGGGCLGLVGGDGNSCNVTSKYPFVAIEFDSFKNPWDPDYDHMAIDVTSVVTNVSSKVDYGLINRTTAYAWITYDSLTQNLSVFLTYDAHHVFSGDSNLSHKVDLSAILPEKVRVGFSAATGENIELHNILSWNFSSTLPDTNVSVPAPPINQTLYLPITLKSQSKSNMAWVGGLIVCIIFLALGLGSLALMWWRRRSGERSVDLNSDVNDDDFDQETGPRRFSYIELSCATNNFQEERKLGEGGFGGVYRGYLSDLSREIAVKKISKGSKQGKKEYVSEVKIISRLRHRNLVQLIGWCHEQGDLLLVYEYLPNGSLDSHLYPDKRKAILPWQDRFKIAQDLASALLYLHGEWEECVLHRDIKSSNVMLDSNFNAKLGDFGLARLVDHHLGSQTTMLAGTLGYLAPECFMTGKATKESDVYSFGVVALEIACGRQPVIQEEESCKVNIVEWVWSLYGEGCLHEAVDEGLEGETNVQEIECLTIVGLWCCHPDYTQRPSIRQVINVLNFESPLPSLSTKFPVPVYCSAPMNAGAFLITSSSDFTGSSVDTTSSSSKTILSGTAPLLSEHERV